MVIVLGSIIIKEDFVDDALRISQKHVEHSRTEPGCITHGVHIGFENPQRLVFVEKWSDQAALEQHFKESTSLEFINSLKSICAQAPEISIYDATQIK